MLEKVETELPNPKTSNLDNMSIVEILRIINQEDATVPLAIAENLEKIAIVVEMCVKAIKNGGRIIYGGAGTSGRIAIIDAVETVPTFGVPEGLFLPIMAGGEEAFFRSLEAIEDSEKQGEIDLKKHDVSSKDLVIGLTASGRTPYVKGMLLEAKRIGCHTVLISNVANPALGNIADVSVTIRTGPEIIAGSTRMKAGTAQKMVLNMISTVTMIKLGKTYKNYMIDVKILNEKLKARAARMISEITGIGQDESLKYLKLADNSPKLAALMILSKKSKEECIDALSKREALSEALELLRSDKE